MSTYLFSYDRPPFLLLSIHKKQKLSYDKTIDALSNALFREKTEIRKMVSMMEGFNLLELKKNEKGEEIIHQSIHLPLGFACSLMSVQVSANQKS